MQLQYHIKLVTVNSKLKQNPTKFAVLLYQVGHFGCYVLLILCNFDWMQLKEAKFWASECQLGK